MRYTFLGKHDSIVYIESDVVLITDTQSALDLMMTVKYEHDCHKIVLDKRAVNEAFFNLSSGMAGDVLQKFINYHTKLAIIGDFTQYTGKAWQDFMYECNSGRDIFFVDRLDLAVEKLT